MPGDALTLCCAKIVRFQSCSFCSLQPAFHASTYASMLTGTINGEFLLSGGGKRNFSPLIDTGITDDDQYPDPVLFGIEGTWAN